MKSIKDEAEELFTSFMYYPDETFRMSYNDAKHCSIMTIDYMLSTLENLNPVNNIDEEEVFESYNRYLKVKKLIKLL